MVRDNNDKNLAGQQSAEATVSALLDQCPLEEGDHGECVLEPLSHAWHYHRHIYIGFIAIG
jgi:hypothetical protein